MNRPLSLLLLLISSAGISTSVSAQPYRITGKVTDAISREPIPFVNIYMQGKNVGTTTDFDGTYLFEAIILDDTLIASSIGYTPGKKPLVAGQSQTINFILERADISLEEIVIKPEAEKENPAHALLRKIIKNKERNSNITLSNYSYEAYNKVELDLYDWKEKFQDRKVMRPFQFVFDRIDSLSEDKPFLPVFLSESLSDYYYRSQPQNEAREVIKASKQSGMENESLSQFLGSMYQEVSVYENWPGLFYKSFASPINDNGLNYYIYELVDSGFIDNDWCYKMTFRPKNKGSFTFVGDLWVADYSYAIKQVSMEVAPHVNVNYIDKISVFQQFAHVKDSLWMMEKDKIVVRFKVTENMVGIIGRKTASFKNYNINLPDIDNYFESRSDIMVDEKAFAKDDTFWVDNRHEELTLNETGVYEMVDSLKNTRAFNNWVDVFNMVATGYYDPGWIEIGPVMSLYSLNDVEGHRFRVGLRTSNEMSRIVRVGVYGAYGIWDKRFKYGADILVVITKDPRQSLGAEYFYDLDLKATGPAQFSQDNFLTGLVRRNVPQKLSYVRQASVFYEKEWKVGYSNRLTLKYRDITPQFPFYYLKDNDNSHADTVQSVVTTEAIFRAKFAYHEKFLSGDFDRTSLGTKYPTLVLQYTLGLKGIIGSEYTYHKLELVFNDHAPVNPIGTFHYTLIMGKTFGNLPYLLLNVMPGNETYFYNRYAFNLMNQYEFVTDMYAALYLRHHFEGFFLNKIPGIRKLKWREVIFAKAIAGTMTDENQAANDPGSVENNENGFIIPYPKPYVEVGFGIENIFKLFEIDFLWRVTHRDAPQAPSWGIQGGMKIDF